MTMHICAHLVSMHSNCTNLCACVCTVSYYTQVHHQRWMQGISHISCAFSRFRKTYVWITPVKHKSQNFRRKPKEFSQSGLQISWLQAMKTTITTVGRISENNTRNTNLKMMAYRYSITKHTVKASRNGPLLQHWALLLRKSMLALLRRQVRESQSVITGQRSNRFYKIKFLFTSLRCFCLGFALPIAFWLHRKAFKQVQTQCYFHRQCCITTASCPSWSALDSH